MQKVEFTDLAGTVAGTKSMPEARTFPPTLEYKGKSYAFHGLRPDGDSEIALYRVSEPTVDP